MPFSNQGRDGSRHAKQPHELPTVTFTGDACVMAYWRNVLVVAWGTPSTPSLVEELRRLMARVTAQHEKIAIVHITFGAMALPNKETRAGFSSLVQEFGPKLDHTAVLVGEAGFWASAVRSVLTSFLVTTRAYKFSLCGSVAEAVRWLSHGHFVAPGTLVDAGELHQALEWVLDLPELRSLRAKVP